MAETFHSKKLFRKQDRVKLSYKEAAARRKVCRRTCITHLQRDVENGYLLKRPTTHRCARYKRPLHGRNIFFLTKKGREALGRQATPKEKRDQAEKATNNAILRLLASSPARRKEDFQKLQEVCPDWWLGNRKLFEKTLSLLGRKLRKGYRVRSPARWISATLKDQGIGFKRRQARRLSSDLQSVSLSSQRLSQISPYRFEVIESLKVLIKRGIIDCNEATLIRLSRKGYSFLAIAVRVFFRIEKNKKLKNPAKFFNWLFSLKDPNDVFKPKPVSPEELLDWTEGRLEANKERCVFLSNMYTEPVSKDPSKIYVCFLTSRKTPLKSYMRVFFFQKGLFSTWREAFLSLSKPTFKKEFLHIFGEPKKTAFQEHIEKPTPARRSNQERAKPRTLAAGEKMREDKPPSKVSSLLPGWLSRASSKKGALTTKRGQPCPL